MLSGFVRYHPGVAKTNAAELLSRAAYGRGHQAGEKYREGLATFFEKTCAKYGVRGSSRMDDEEDDDSVLPRFGGKDLLQLELLGG